MKVLKFGGSSVATPERISAIVDILRSYHKRGEKFTVVFSAFGGVTDGLIEMGRLASKGDNAYEQLLEDFQHRHRSAAKALLGNGAYSAIEDQLEENHIDLRRLLHGIFLVQEASPRTMDYVLSFGERSSAFIISQALKKEGIPASFLDARSIIKTDKAFGSANVDFELSYQRIREHYIQSTDIQIVTGFIASAKGGLTTTLGRGGSDFTASILAAALGAEVIEIWTDVDGVLTSDPRKVNKAFTIPEMTYAEAMEMSHFGAKVIYPPTIQPALSKNIPLRIRNTFNPDFEGTLVTAESNPGDYAVKGISSISEISLLTLQGSGMFGVPGIAARLFSALAAQDINIILITQGSSEHSISFAVQPSVARKAKRAAEKEFAREIAEDLVDPVKQEDNLCVVAIIGENMRYAPGIAARLFQALGKNGVNAIAIAQGSSELNVSVVISGEDEGKALNAIHDAFFLSDTSTIHVFMIGVGLIGSTLIDQIKQQHAYLAESRHFNIQICGLANSRKMLFDPDGIPLEGWKERLMSEGEKSTPDGFADEMIEMNLSNSVFVDNTANDIVASLYEKVLDASISVSTPNKIATSSSYLRYQNLKSIAQKRGVKYFYETNVGAGLPIITTLNDLITSGDQIQIIEGVLSGSLSYIFNSFDGSRPFSEVVLEAKDKGYTEPDPRIDLNGIDVRRKLVILAREIGLPIESQDVEIQGILPEECVRASNVADFFAALEKNNDVFAEMISTATAKNEKLRMVASLEDGRPVISLQSVGVDNAFYGLSGSDNMVIFTTARYNERPLVVRGPGAGAEVTAAGVFAEIISIGNYLT
ncbi:MAG: bifunctional aspartate kinase/homoserine dehydrogenase I [Bacteroidia bacterium]|nr:bifunctional aspartate kinase/homoserine dehydrogenase I [Bacteroidia bacterium]